MTAKRRKRRKGFSLIEMVAVAIMLAIITVAVVIISEAVSGLRIRARNNVLLSTHNLNVMEQLRQEMNRIGVGEALEVYYGFLDDADEYAAIKAGNATEATHAAAVPGYTYTPRDPNCLDNYRLNFSTFNYLVNPADNTVIGGELNTLVPVGNTGDIRTDVYLDISTWDNHHIYQVRIESTVIGYAQKVTNTFVLTDIGIERSPVGVVTPP